jgi:transcriptional regulator with XRE-family HTH domain
MGMMPNGTGKKKADNPVACDYCTTIDMQKTGEKIRRIREASGYTVDEVSRYCGFETPRAVYKWQKGETMPSLDHMAMLAKLFNVPLGELVMLRQEEP